MKEIIEKYYCPLQFSIDYRFSGEYGYDSNKIENELALDYLPQIAEFVENNDGGDMIDCFEDCGIEKLKDIRWSVEVVDGVLYGCIIATLSEPLTPSEDTKLKQKISGQNSDGFGECLEQRPLRVEAGDIYISFYNSGEKYFVLNKEEFSYYLGKKDFCENEKEDKHRINKKQPYKFWHEDTETIRRNWRLGVATPCVIASVQFGCVAITLSIEGYRNLPLDICRSKKHGVWVKDERIHMDAEKMLLTMKSWEDIEDFLYVELITHCESNNIDYTQLCDEEDVEAPATHQTPVTKKRCPKCGAESFYVTAHVCQDWKVDCNGTFIETVEECSQVLHQPDDDDIWTCANCGFDAAGSEFNVQEEQIPVPSRKRLLKIFSQTVAAYSFELEEHFGNSGFDGDVDKKIDATLMKDFKITKVEMKTLFSLPNERVIELIREFIPPYEFILHHQDYASEDEIHAVVLNEFGMTEEEYEFFTKK